MSQLWVRINYRVAATLIKGLRIQLKITLKWLDKLEQVLDKAAEQTDVDAKVCTRKDCPNRKD